MRRLHYVTSKGGATPGSESTRADAGRAHWRTLQEAIEALVVAGLIEAAALKETETAVVQAEAIASEV